MHKSKTRDPMEIEDASAQLDSTRWSLRRWRPVRPGARCVAAPQWGDRLESWTSMGTVQPAGLHSSEDHMRLMAGGRPPSSAPLIRRSQRCPCLRRREARAGGSTNRLQPRAEACRLAASSMARPTGAASHGEQNAAAPTTYRE
jgi:hypothetical protein